VKRQVPRSPGHGCKPIGQGRSASFGKMPGTDEARVLVVEAVGSKKSVSTHRGRASRQVERQAVEGRSSPEQAVETADAGDGGPSLNRMGCDGRRGEARKRPHAPQAASGETGAASETGAQASRRIVKEEAGCVALSGVARRRVRTAEMPDGWAVARRGADTMAGVLSRSSIFS
jgi:uncharacterized caspase-like protein